MNNISFQGRSTLIFDNKAYDIARDATRKAHRHLGFSNTCNLTAGKVFTAETNDTHIAVLVRNEKDGFLKFFPLNQKIDEMLSDMAEKIENLKKQSNKQLTAWIMGGASFDKANAEKTVKTINRIADMICDRPDIDTSILAGSKNAENKIVIHPFKDTLELTLDKPKTQQYIDDSFDIVEINNTTFKDAF